MSRLRERYVLATWLALAMSGLGRPMAATAQERVTLLTEVTFYGDNTEFFNRFRDGETLLGTSATIAVDIAMTDLATFRGGLFVNHRFGSEQFAEQWRPVFSLTIENGPSRFIFGTLDTVPRDAGVGPDLVGPHRLLPPIQVETLAFTRPYEAGIQWRLDAARIEQDAWVNWQRLNTTEYRERLDYGLRGRVPLDTGLPLAVGYQVHHVHEGGQLFDEGPVSDSIAAGPGIIIEPQIGLFDAASIETYMMWSKHFADRAMENGAEHGHGLFVRAAATKNGWRGHLIVWGACDWLKEEGDVNYGSRLRDGTLFRPTRHYGELGLAKAFYEADGVVLEGAARLHRVEKDYNYSFRVLAHVDFGFPLLTR